MNIGFVSTWYERGAAYVTKQYIELLKYRHEVFVYARGGLYPKDDPVWNQPYVTWGKITAERMLIDWNDFNRWVKKNKLDVVFFNEQQNMEILADIKQKMPDLIIGSYIDYYKRNTVEYHKIYDFLICNTKRHFEVFKWHPQCYYVPWGTDTDIFKYVEYSNREIPTFFHSMGYSTRKGTLPLLQTFLETDLWLKSCLIIHTQSDYLRKCGYNYEELKLKNVQIIEKTVTAPGLYHLGDVYVYPSELDGLGLTIYEALSCGMPVIGTDVPPINEPINDLNGTLINVEKTIAREDGYYWPLSIIDKNSLYECMTHYIDNYEKLPEKRKRIREDAILNWEWKNRKEQVCSIFENVQLQHMYTETELKGLIKRRSFGEKIDALTWYLTTCMKK